MADATPFDYAIPDPAAVRLIDVAVSLSNTCRYRGMLPFREFISVAEHVVLSLRVAELMWPEAEAAFLWAILHHDDEETLTGDLPGPAKVAFRKLYGDGWDRFAADMARTVREAFSVDPSLLELSHAKQIDVWAYELERRWLYGWGDVELPPQLEDVVLIPGVTVGVPPLVARGWYLTNVARLAPLVGREDLAAEASGMLGLQRRIVDGAAAGEERSGSAR